MFIEDNNFLTLEQKQTIENLFFGNLTVPYYLSLAAVKPNDGGFHFIHQIKHRETGEWSGLKNLAIDILNSFCKKNNITYNNIFRCAVNITFNNGSVYKCPIHFDHKFNHNQLLIYLNDAVGDTVILDDDKNVIISPEKFKGIYFDNKQHYHYFPIKGIRVVMVFTFL